MTTDLVLLPAGVLAGMINGVAGGGSLVTFPVLLSLGYSPYVANVTNAVAVCPSSIGAAISYRQLLKSNWRIALKISLIASVGAVLGTLLLLITSEGLFEQLAPWLIAVAAVLLAFQPKLIKYVKRIHVDSHNKMAFVGTFVIGIYGGYFGMAMGVMILAVLGVTSFASLQVLNAYKTAISLFINCLCVVIFSLFGPVAWPAACFMAIGTFIGGYFGGNFAKAISEKLLRMIVVTIAISAAVAIGLL